MLGWVKLGLVVEGRNALVANSCSMIFVLQLMIPAEAAHDTMAALGELGMLQFKDLNAEKSAFQRTYASQIKRCDEMARILRFLNDEIKKAGLLTGARLGDRELELDELEVRLTRLESEVVELTANTDRLKRSYNELLELQVVLERATLFFEDARTDAGRQDEQHQDVYDDSGRLSNFLPPPPFSLSLSLSFFLSYVSFTQNRVLIFYLLLALAFVHSIYHRCRTFFFHQ